MRAGKIWPTGTSVIAVETDFYELPELDELDLFFLEEFIKKNDPASHAANRQLVQLLQDPYQTAAFASKEWKVKLPQVDDFLQRNTYEVLENFHMEIENSFIPHLDAALKGDLSFYPNDAFTFIRFICVQYMRTKKIKDGMKDFPFYGRLWNILALMLSTNVGATLYLERHHRKLYLVNAGTEEFITGDQPVINLKSQKPALPDKLSLYYPISPKLALILGEVDEAPRQAMLTKEEVDDLNMAIFDSSHSIVFAKSKDVLEMLAFRPAANDP